MEVTERLREAVVDGPRDTDPQPSAKEATQRGDLIATALGCGESRARMRRERLAGPREAVRAPIAVKERLPEFALQATDLRADGGLGNRDAGRGARELPLLRNRHEVRELPQAITKSSEQDKQPVFDLWR